MNTFLLHIYIKYKSLHVWLQKTVEERRVQRRSEKDYSRDRSRDRSRERSDRYRDRSRDRSRNRRHRSRSRSRSKSRWDFCYQSQRLLGINFQLDLIMCLLLSPLQSNIKRQSWRRQWCCFLLFIYFILWSTLGHLSYFSNSFFCNQQSFYGTDSSIFCYLNIFSFNQIVVFTLHLKSLFLLFCFINFIWNACLSFIVWCISVQPFKFSIVTICSFHIFFYCYNPSGFVIP